MDFHGGQFWCWCAKLSWIIYQIPSYSKSCSMGLCFWVRISHINLTHVSFISFGLSLWNINSIISVPARDFQPWDRRPSLLHIEFVHTGASIFTKYLYPMIFLVNVMCYWFQCDCIFFGVCVINLFWAYMCCWCVCHPFWTFEVYSWMLSHDLLWTWYYTCVWLFLPFWFHFLPIISPLVSHGAVVLVFLLLFFKYNFWQFFNFWCNC